MKKIIIGLITLIVSLSICLGTGVSAAVAPATNFSKSLPGWGTEADGIIPKYDQAYATYHNVWTETNSFPNAGFEKGLMYWSSSRKNNPTDNVDILTDSTGNKYLKFNKSKTEWQGIESVPFIENRVKAGDNVVIVFDWKVDPNFQVYLHQIVYKNRSGDKDKGTPLRIAHNGDAKRQEIIVEGEGGWNTAYCKPDRKILELNPAMPYYCFNWGVQICQDMTCAAEVDNLRMGIYNESENIIYDLDGKIMYDIDNLVVNESEDPLTSDMFSGFDYNLKYDDIYDENGQIKGSVKPPESIDSSVVPDLDDNDGSEKPNDSSSSIKPDSSESSEDADDSKNSKDTDKKPLKPFAILWIIIACGAVMLIAAAIGAVFIIKAKKSQKETDLDGSSQEDGPQMSDE